MKEPKIRFNEFKGEWNSSAIGDIATFSKGRGYSKSDLKTKGNPIILYGRMYTDYSFVIDSVETYATLQKGSVLSDGNEVVIPASGETPEDIAVASAVTMKNVILGGDLNILKFDKNKILSTFAAMQISCGRTRKELSNFAQGKTVVHLHNSNISKGHFCYPPIAEQHSIASFFTTLDAQISASTSRLASLKQIKAASLQAMFPQEGETVPKLRFKGFEGEWEKVKLGDIAELYRGLTYSPNNISTTGVRVLRSSNIADGQFVISKNDVFVEDTCINIILAQKGDILITAANGSPRLVGKHAIITNDENGPLVAGGFMLLARSKESTFINASMGSSWYFKFLKSGVSGGNGSIGNLNKSDLEQVSMPYPKEKRERDAIASFFTNLDRQITLQSQRLEKLKQIKAACLDKMFV